MKAVAGFIWGWEQQFLQRCQVAVEQSRKPQTGRGLPLGPNSPWPLSSEHPEPLINLPPHLLLSREDRWNP